MSVLNKKSAATLDTLAAGVKENNELLVALQVQLEQLWMVLTTTMALEVKAKSARKKPVKADNEKPKKEKVVGPHNTPMYFEHAYNNDFPEIKCFMTPEKIALVNDSAAFKELSDEKKKKKFPGTYYKSQISKEDQKKVTALFQAWKNARLVEHDTGVQPEPHTDDASDAE